MKQIQYPPSPLSRALSEAAKTYRRIAVTGWPKVGKTTAVDDLPCDHVIIHTDELLFTKDFRRDWSGVIRDLSTMYSFIVEGVDVADMLAQGLQVDYVIAVQRSAPPQHEHRTMAQAVFTILDRTRIPYQLVVNDFLSIS